MWESVRQECGHGLSEGCVLGGVRREELFFGQRSFEVGVPDPRLTAHYHLARIFGEAHVRKSAHARAEHSESTARRWVVLRVPCHDPREAQPLYDEDARYGALRTLRQHGQASAAGG